MGPAQPSASRAGLEKQYRIEAFDITITERKGVCPDGREGDRDVRLDPMLELVKNWAQHQVFFEVRRGGRRVSQGVILRKPTPTRCPIFHPNTPSPIASILSTISWPGTRVSESYWKSVAPDARDLRYSKGRPDHGISDRDKKHQPKKNYGIPTSIYSCGDRHRWKRRTR